MPILLPLGILAALTYLPRWSMMGDPIHIDLLDLFPNHGRHGYNPFFSSAVLATWPWLATGDVVDTPLVIAKKAQLWVN
ncbi:uncharacterized protein ANIA_11309 [Aspergillus nidulans FGSC A4]|uniref:Uncharacterized protein n=1 Tax=Emericella nidulans (strain FGSC A4 / ATCC 38163 / CBS 112.46 / NRRL 194 / M139) TaxID=227321 RepID=C8VN73_EMENI|nr:hypothetical protein [Aspergillus nidulans FGSC A4]CBF85155.1 TPA: hypothetical protein ANIA_11309 [Aspergillus nidulans FGSC A4]